MTQIRRIPCLYDLRHLCLPESPPKNHLSFRMRLDELRGDLGRSLEELGGATGTQGLVWRSLEEVGAATGTDPICRCIVRERTAMD